MVDVVCETKSVCITPAYLSPTEAVRHVDPRNESSPLHIDMPVPVLIPTPSVSDYFLHSGSFLCNYGICGGVFDLKKCRIAVEISGNACRPIVIAGLEGILQSHQLGLGTDPPPLFWFLPSSRRVDHIWDSQQN